MPDKAFAGKTWWLVGASEGLGRAMALGMHAKGASLILSARAPDRLEALAAELGGATIASLDATDPTSVAEAAATLPPFDGVIYNAGYYEPMTAQNWDAKAVSAMTAVNYSGACHILGHAVPALLAKGAGRIVLIGSLSGFRGLPGAIGYGASKAALMHLAENLRVDLRDTGVTVQRINPGFIKTRLTDKNDFDMIQVMTPEDAAARTLRAIESGRFSTSFPAPFAWVFTLGQHLPISWFHRIVG